MTATPAYSLVGQTNVFNGIYYPETDGEPLPDGFEQEPLFTRVTPVLRSYLQRYYDVIVSGNTFLYYEEGNLRAFVSPDCYVAFGVTDEAIRPHNSYFTWHVGKVPDFVLEIASESTANRDVNEKPGLYAGLGISEYWRYDWTPDSEYYGERLVGERLVGGRYERLPVEPGPDGMLRGHSPALGLDICWDNGRLRFYDPHRNVWLRDYDETQEALGEAEALAETERLAREEAVALAETERLAREEAEALAETERLAREEAVALAEGERLAREEAVALAEGERLAREEAVALAEGERLARAEAVARLAKVEAELHRLRGEEP